MSERETSVTMWEPNKVSMEDCSMTKFMLAVSRNYSLTFTNYEDLHAWSISNPESFWSECWDFLGILGNKASPLSINLSDMMNARFFPNGTCNFAENCLTRQDDGPAIMYSQENIVNRTVSWSELRAKVISLAQSLQASGIQAGDRVCAIAANVPETVISMLAVAATGAVWSSVSPDFGVEGIMERFSQIQPKILFYTPSYHNKNKLYDVSSRAEEVGKRLGVILSIPLTPEGFQEYILSKSLLAPFNFASTNFNDPLFIMFSSGTTGKPKCIVHRHGVLLQLMKEHQLHCNIKQNDRVFYYTTTTWMMWNWLSAVLASQATILLYEGNPFFPDCNSLFDFAAEANFFGVSAKFLDSVKVSKEFRSFPFGPQMHTIASTGSPLMPEAFDFVYSHIKTDLNLASICGGTDILSCFILGCPLKPVKRGFAQCRGLGMDVQIWDDTGNAIIGERGELVCTTPFVSMPLGFFNDVDKSLYKKAYFSDWPNVWKHGDYCSIDSDGHVYVFGRSDATLKPGGVRIGTAEIYQVLATVDYILDSVCCGIELKPGEESVALFVVLKDGVLTEGMRSEIKKSISEATTRHHVPSLIHQVKDIPKTHSGKTMELAVKNVINKLSVKNVNAIANPAALEEFKQFAVSM